MAALSKCNTNGWDRVARLLFIGHESLEVDVHAPTGNGERMIFMKG